MVSGAKFQSIRVFQLAKSRVPRIASICRSRTYCRAFSIPWAVDCADLAATSRGGVHLHDHAAEEKHRRAGRRWQVPATGRRCDAQPDARPLPRAGPPLHGDHTRGQDDPAIPFKHLVQTTRLAMPVSSSMMMNITLLPNRDAGERERFQPPPAIVRRAIPSPRHR